MAGTLKVSLMPPMDLETGATELGKVTSYALGYMEQLGVPLTAAPASGFKGEMAPTLTNLGDDELGNLLSNLGEWCAFLDVRLAIADSERASAETAYEFIKASIRMSLRMNEEGKKYTVSDKNDITTTDPRVHEAEKRALYTEATYKIIKAMSNNAQRSWETVSRRITQRGQEIERMKRENGVAGVPSASRMFRRT